MEKLPFSSSVIMIAYSLTQYRVISQGLPRFV